MIYYAQLPVSMLKSMAMGWWSVLLAMVWDLYFILNHLYITIVSCPLSLSFFGYPFSASYLNDSVFFFYFVTHCYLAWPGNEEPGHMVEGQTFTIGEWSALCSKINIAFLGKFSFRSCC